MDSQNFINIQSQPGEAPSSLLQLGHTSVNLNRAPQKPPLPHVVQHCAVQICYTDTKKKKHFDKTPPVLQRCL